MVACRRGRCCAGLSPSTGMHVSLKLFTAPFKLLFYLGLGTGAVCYHFASVRLGKRQTEDPREAVGQREVESLTRGDRWVHLPKRQPGRVVPMTFAALGVLTWPLLFWRYGFLRSALFCVPCGALQAYGLTQILDGSTIFSKLVIPVCLAAVALLLARVDTSWHKRQLQRRGWVSQGSVWVSRATLMRGRLARHGA